jgi:hypothetical protein
MDLGEIGWGNVDWIDVDQDRDHWTSVMNTVIKFLSSCTMGSFSRRTQLHRVNYNKLLLTSPPCRGPSVSIVRLLTNSHVLCLSFKPCMHKTVHKE